MQNIENKSITSYYYSHLIPNAPREPVFCDFIQYKTNFFSPPILWTFINKKRGNRDNPIDTSDVDHSWRYEDNIDKRHIAFFYVINWKVVKVASIVQHSDFQVCQIFGLGLRLIRSCRVSIKAFPFVQSLERVDLTADFDVNPYWLLKSPSRYGERQLTPRSHQEPTWKLLGSPRSKKKIRIYDKLLDIADHPEIAWLYPENQKRWRLEFVLKSRFLDKFSSLEDVISYGNCCRSYIWDPYKWNELWLSIYHQLQSHKDLSPQEKLKLKVKILNFIEKW